MVAASTTKQLIQCWYIST